jgi:hypothetical protein
VLAKRKRLRNRLTGARLGNFGGRGFPYVATPMLAVATPYDTIRSLLLAEYRGAEAAATDDLVDSVGGRTLTQVGNPGVGGTYRTYDGNQYASRSTVSDALGLVNTLYTVSVHFRTPPGIDGQTRQIVCLREAGSASGTLTFILRQEGANILLYHGNGTGSGFTQAAQIVGITVDTPYHFIWRVNNLATGSLSMATNGGAVSKWASGQAGTTAEPGVGFKFGVGGDVLEKWVGRIGRVRVYNSALSDDEMLLDYQDPLGV